MKRPEIEISKKSIPVEVAATMTALALAIPTGKAIGSAVRQTIDQINNGGKKNG